MKSYIEFLLDEIQLFFTPVSGEFDVEHITKNLSQTGFALAHPSDPCAFAIFADKEPFEYWTRHLKTHPNETFPYVFRARVQPHVVIVWPQSDPEEFKLLSAQFVEWLIKHRACRITNEFGTDITDMEAYPRE